MKPLTHFVVFLLIFGALTVEVTTYAQRKRTAPPSRIERANAAAELAKIRDEYIQATTEYKASLEKLLAIYEGNERKAAQRLVQARELFSQGLVGPQELKDTELALATAKEKSEGTRKEIATADAQIANTLVEAQAEEQIAALKVRKSNSPLTVAQSPVVRGLRLEQTVATLTMLFPSYETSLQLKQNAIGFSETKLFRASLRERQSLNGVRWINLKYLDGKLASIDITYDDTVSWPSNLHFTAAVAEQLHLPVKGWLNKDPSWLVCNGFFVETSAANHLRIERTDLAAEIRKRQNDLIFELRRRQRELEEKRRREFKP